MMKETNGVLLTGVSFVNAKSQRILFSFNDFTIRAVNIIIINAFKKVKRQQKIAFLAVSFNKGVG